MSFEFADSLIIIDQLGDGRMRSTDGTCVAVLDGNRAELHRPGVEGQQPVRQQFADAREILQRLLSERVHCRVWIYIGNNQSGGVSYYDIN